MTYGTMEKIETVTVTGATAASIVFSNIPQTYSDLLVKISARLTFNASTASLGAFLNSAAADTSYRWLRGNGSVAASGNDTAQNDFYLGEVNAATSTSSTFSSYDLYIPNYTGSTQKSLSADGVSENNATLAYQYFSAGLCTKTAAVTTLTVRGFAGGSGDLVQHSTATLYGITRVPAGAKATGGVIYDDASYWYHVFNASGTFTPTQNLTVEYLVIAGGGGGGSGVTDVDGGAAGAGGGGGGYRSSISGESSGGGASAESALSLTSGTNYTVTVGAGGSGGANANTNGTKGGDSTFSTITSSGGGVGQSRFGGSTNINGGSGGGISDGGTPGTGTTNQGYAGGGGGGTGTTRSAAGGGGAGSVGGNSVATHVAGNGGSGVSSSVTGSSVSRAGGGGGGLGGTSGGNAGTASAGGGAGGARGTAGTAGTANTGGGAGGSGAGTGSSPAGANGGSGIVIVRYAK